MTRTSNHVDPLFGARVRKLRVGLGLTHKELASLAQISTKYVAHIEGGRVPSAQARERLAQVLQDPELREKEPNLDLYELRYKRRSDSLHLLPKPFVPDAAPLCRRPSGSDPWLGEGSFEEEWRAAKLPLCKMCMFEAVVQEERR